MTPKKYRWSKVYESNEEEITHYLAAKNISAQRWAAEAFAVSDETNVEHSLTLWCAEGSLSLSTAETTLSIQPGDAVRLASNTAYTTTAGIAGCVCYQAAI